MCGPGILWLGKGIHSSLDVPVEKPEFRLGIRTAWQHDTAKAGFQIGRLGIGENWGELGATMTVKSMTSLTARCRTAPRFQFLSGIPENGPEDHSSRMPGHQQPESTACRKKRGERLEPVASQSGAPGSRSLHCPSGHGGLD